MLEYRVERVEGMDISAIDDKWADIAPGVLVDNADGSKADLSTTFKLAYSESGDLYFYYDIEDSAPRVTMSGYNEPIYDEETVEFFFATERDLRDYLEVEFNVIGGVFAANIDNDLMGHTTIHFIKDNPIESHVIERDGGYYIVGRIDASAFKVEMDEWLFNAYRIKRREDNSMILSAFSPTFIEQFHRPNYFVKLVFVR